MPDTTFADAPVRSTGSVTLAWGLVPVALSLYAATEEPQIIERHTYTAALNPVGQKLYDKTTGKDVDKDATIMAVDVGDDKVALSDEEMAVVTAETAVGRLGIDIEALIPLDELAWRYPMTKLYQVRPAGTKKEPNPSAAKAYRLFMTALEERGVAALVKFALRGNIPRYAAVCPDGTLRFLFFDNEIRTPREQPDVDVTDRELDMAHQLLGVYETDTPELLNPARDLLLKYVAEKAAGKKPVEAPAEAPSVKTGDDLIAQLEASVAAAKVAPPPRKARPAKRGARTPSKKKAEEAA